MDMVNLILVFHVEKFALKRLEKGKRPLIT